MPEATQLVLQAGPMGKGGEVFILDMGEPGLGGRVPPADWEGLLRGIEGLREKADVLEEGEIREALRGLIPEFQGGRFVDNTPAIAMAAVVAAEGQGAAN